MTFSNFTKSRKVERVAVEAHLRSTAIGATVTYGEIKAATGVDCRRDRHVLSSARTTLRDNDGVLFEAVASVGVRRLSAAEIAVDQSRRKRAHQQAKLGLKELATIREPGSLPPGERLLYNASTALLGVIAASSSTKASKLIQSNQVSGHPPPTMADALRLLSRDG